MEFVKEGLTFTGEDTPMATLLLSLIGAFAEFERARGSPNWRALVRAPGVSRLRNARQKRGMMLRQQGAIPADHPRRSTRVRYWSHDPVYVSTREESMMATAPAPIRCQLARSTCRQFTASSCFALPPLGPLFISYSAITSCLPSSKI